MSRRSATAVALGVSCAALLAAGAVTLVFWGPNSRGSGGALPAAPLPATPDTSPLGAAGVRPPAQGALFGAWVKPAKFTEPGRIAAKEQFEAEMGRDLDIVHDFHTWSDPFPSEFDREIARSGSIPLISWAGTDTRVIAAGDEDALITERARAVKAFGSPILLRWRWEMDRPNLRAEVHGPAEYIAAWRRIRAIFAREHVTNASFVWCPLAEGFADGRAQPYYPGDDHVEWLCADAYTTDPATESFADLVDPFLDWAEPRRKPVVIGEFGALPAAEGVRAAWLEGVNDLVRDRPAVKGIVYFDSDITQRGTLRRWSLRWDAADVAAFAALGRDPLFNRNKRPVSVR